MLELMYGDWPIAPHYVQPNECTRDAVMREVGENVVYSILITS